MITRTVLGIDPGQSGGLVLLDETGKVLRKHPIPIIELKQTKIDKKTKKVKHLTKTMLDTVALNRLFEELSTAGHAVIEQVSAMPGQGVVSIFTFGRVLGCLEAFLIAHKIPHTFVPPSTWSKTMHAGISGVDDPKGRSRIALNRIFPGEDFRVSDKGRVPHEGMMDAALMAEYMRRQLYLKGQAPEKAEAAEVDLPDFDDVLAQEE